MIHAAKAASPWTFVNLGPQEIEPPVNSGALAFLGIRLTTAALGWWRGGRQMLRGWSVSSVDGCYLRWSFGWIRIGNIPASSISHRLAPTNKGVEGQAAAGHPKTRLSPAYHFGYSTMPYSSWTLVGRLRRVTRVRAMVRRDEPKIPRVG